ncbi:MAG: NACHT domain-containing protein [Bacteroidetes bacterium]|nr:MAG: NACHT domain-containing protein [Bacteroidota bacterium]
MPPLKKIFFFRILLGLITVVIGTFVVGYITELTAGDFKSWIESIVGKENVLLTLIGLGGFSAVLLLVTYLIETKPEPKEEKKSIKDAIEKAISDTREGLIKSYQSRLDSKMAQRLPINLQLKYTLEGTTTKAKLYDNRTIGEKSIKEELISIFDKHRGRLLIIGDPGSGKTTLLLQLAVTLLKREGVVIPIIINIVTWRKRFNSVEEWFGELLPQMGFSKLLAQLLIKEHRILPLFDGLDELAEENRKPCLEAIGEFGKTNELEYVICSRKVEYAQTVDAPVYCEIAVKPLTLPQIKKQLKELGAPEANGLLDAISKDNLLKEIIKVPFYLNTAQILFSSMITLEELNFKTTTLEERKEELVKMFIDQQLIKMVYPKEKSKHWLSFLAFNMNKPVRNLVVFELIDLQYNWSTWTKFQLIIARFIKGSVISLPVGIILGLLYSWFSESWTTTMGLIFVVLFITMMGLIMGLQSDIHFLSIKTFGIISFSIKGIISEFKKRPLFNLILSLLFGVILGLFSGLYYGLIAGLFFFLWINLLFGSLAAFKSFSFIHIKKPYQRFSNSFLFLNFSIIQHWFLRCQLYKKDLLPIKLVYFLNELTKNYLLESDGTNWRFRHKILQDYFADKWKGELENNNSVN